MVMKNDCIHYRTRVKKEKQMDGIHPRVVEYCLKRMMGIGGCPSKCPYYKTE